MGQARNRVGAGLPVLVAPVLVAIGLVAAAAGLPRAAVAGPSGDPQLELRLVLEPAAARAGEALTLSVVTRIPPGFKLYGMGRVERGPQPTRLTLDTSAPVAPEGGWYAPPPIPRFDPNFRMEVAGYSEEVTFSRVLRLQPGASPGKQELRVDFSGQICDERRCLLQRRTLSAELAVDAGAPRPERLSRPQPPGVEQDEGAAAPASASASARVEPASSRPDAGAGVEEGLLGFLLVAFLAGLAALLTPCVFPMVPLTVSFFSKAAGESFGRSLKLAGGYALSIVITFTVAGLAISAVFGAAGMQRFAAHPLFNLAVALLLVAFGLSLLGLFEIRLPSGLIEGSEKLKLRFGSTGQAPSLPAVFFMALTFSLVSFSCTVAFLGVVLVSAAQGHWLRPALGMLSFSTAFALPFFLLALFPQAATRLQRRGGDWLELVKVLLGVLELAAALKFFSNVDLVWNLGLLPRSAVLALWIGLLAVAVLYLLRLVRLHGEGGGADAAAGEAGRVPLSVGRLLLAVGTFALAIYLTAGLVRNSPFGSWVDGWLPPVVYPSAHAAAGDGDAGLGGDGERIPWRSSLEEGLQRARQEQKLVFANFTGVTCTNCRYMEEGVLTRPDVAREIQRFVPVELYTDRGTPGDEASRDFQIRTFGTAALPLYAALTPDQRVVASFPGSTNDVGEFLRFLKGIPDLQTGAGAGALASAGAGAGALAGAGAGTGAGEGMGAGAGTGAGTGAGSAATAGAAAGEGPALDFTLPRLLDGPPFRLSELRGRWVLVHHWASWCGPCRAELKGFFLGIAAELQPRGLTLVTAAFDGGDADGEAAARAFAREVGLDRWPALLAAANPEEAGLPEALQPASFPTTLLLDPAGRLVWQKTGELSEAELRAALVRLER